MDEKHRVQVRNLTKRVGKQTVVEDLSFDVQAGEVFGLLGPRGEGRATVIGMMTGMVSITSGQILLNGNDVSCGVEHAMQGVGAVVGKPDFYPFLTGRENLQHFGRLVGGVTQSWIDEVVARVGLQDCIGHKVKTYTDGLKQRLGLAQALLQKPSVLILDEPTEGPDPVHGYDREDLMQWSGMIRSWALEQGVAVLVSSHLLSVHEQLCDRMAMLGKGRLTGIRTIAREGDERIG